MTTKICIKCNIEQDITCYEDNVDKGKIYKRNVCKLCRKKQYTENRQKKSDLLDYSDTNKTKKCVVCEIDYNILHYNRNKNTIDGYHKLCKKCDSRKRLQEYEERKN